MLLASAYALLLTANTFASPLAKRAAPSFAFSGDAPFSVPVEELAESLTCPNDNPTKSSPPVLLVHGTATTGEESWGKGYVPALKSNKYTACYVTIREYLINDNTRRDSADDRQPTGAWATCRSTPSTLRTVYITSPCYLEDFSQL